MYFVGDHLLVIGGVNNGALATTDVWNVGSNTSCGVPSFPRPLYAHASAVTPIGVIACGGETPGGPYGGQTSCYRLSFENQWISFPALNHKRAYFSLKYMDGVLWAIGGVNARNSMEFIDVSNLDASEWAVESIDGASAPLNIYGRCITEYPNNRFIMIGGNENAVSKFTNHTMKSENSFIKSLSLLRIICMFSISVSQFRNQNLDFRSQEHRNGNTTLDSRETH